MFYAQSTILSHTAGKEVKDTEREKEHRVKDSEIVKNSEMVKDSQIVKDSQMVKAQE